MTTAISYQYLINIYLFHGPTHLSTTVVVQVQQMVRCVCVCLYVWTTAFDLNELWSTLWIKKQCT